MSNNQLPDLSKAEWDLMNVLWRRKRLSVTQVHEHFFSERHWSYNTVKTMMRRLMKKGYLLCDDSARTHLFSPAVPRRKAVSNTLGETLDRLLDDRFGPLVAYAAQRRGLSDEQIEQLKKILK